MLSGAVLDPSTLRDLIPDFKEKGAPLAAEVHDEDVLFLTEHARIALPIIPPPLKNHGNYIISLNQFVRWLTGQVEAAGVDFFSGFAGQDILMDGERVLGVRTGGLASLSARRVHAPIARGVQGRRSAAPWRLPALHFLLRSGKEFGKGCTRTPTKGRRSVG